MQRRKFLHAAAAGTLGMTAAQATGAPLAPESIEEERELIELRTYEMAFGGNRPLLLRYLQSALEPAMRRAGVTQFYVFDELGKEDPKKYHVLIAYRDASAYLAAQDLDSDEEYSKAAKEYHAVKADRPIYSRFTSALLQAFSGMPKVEISSAEAKLFELRYYEGYSEDAVRRKIEMFNKEEISLFLEVGLHPVFFGEMLAGPNRPNLVYMLHFKDMEERDANWNVFRRHEEWNTMKDKPEYANSVSNIRRVFLKMV
ncbi:MAG: NIPSNAP family protein [Bacteroidota bacterium]